MPDKESGKTPKGSGRPSPFVTFDGYAPQAPPPQQVQSAYHNQTLPQSSQQAEVPSNPYGRLPYNQQVQSAYQNHSLPQSSQQAQVPSNPFGRLPSNQDRQASPDPLSNLLPSHLCQALSMSPPGKSSETYLSITCLKSNSKSPSRRGSKKPQGIPHPIRTQWSLCQYTLRWLR